MYYLLKDRVLIEHQLKHGYQLIWENPKPEKILEKNFSETKVDVEKPDQKKTGIPE